VTVDPAAIVNPPAIGDPATIGGPAAIVELNTMSDRT